MGLALIPVLADEAGEVKVGGGQFRADLLGGFTAGTGIGGFADVHLQFTATGTPKAAIGFLGALEKKNLASLIETIEEGGNFIGQRHPGNNE